MGWTASDIPDLSGRRAIVTGANSGLGFYTALELARHGANVVLACRSPERGRTALDQIKSEVPEASVTLEALDLASLASVRAFAASQVDEPLDILINNAGVMALPKMTTADGFEAQFGTNHLGHFALTGLLLPALLAAGTPPRVVTVTSAMHWVGRIKFDDLQGERHYNRWMAYNQSKLANLLFTKELDRRLHEITSAASHPGFASTNLQQAAPKLEGARLREQLMGAFTLVGAQSGAAGALPSLFAATAPIVRGGECYGPRGLFQGRGLPTRVRTAPQSHDAKTAARLWEVSEDLTGVRFALPA